MKNKSMPVVVLLCGIFLFAGCKHEHVWEEATCESPKQCTECGVTEGEPKEHLWKEATCMLPKNCERCGATEGDSLGHDFLSATCVRPEECSVCGETKGEVAAHTGEMVGRCKICDTDQNKDLVLTIGYRHEVIAEYYRTAITEAMQAFAEETQVLDTITERLEQIESPEELEFITIGGHPLLTITLGEYFSWADDLLQRLVWEEQKESYEEMKSVYEDVYQLCGDYPELVSLKEKTREIVDLLPFASPEKVEGKWDGYNQRLFGPDEWSHDEMAELEGVVEQWKEEVALKLAVFGTFEAELKLWEEEYAKVNALFE